MRLSAFLFACVPMFSQSGITIKPFASPEIQILQASDRHAREVLSYLLKDSSDGILSLLPYSLIIENRTGSTIIGYTLHYSYVNAKGESETFNRTHYNFRTVSNGIEIATGTKQLATPLTSHRLTQESQVRKAFSGNASQESSQWLATIQGQSSIVLSLDLVILDTGKVLGPNDSGALGVLQAFISSEVQAIALVNEALTRNASADEVVALLESRYTQEKGRGDPRESAAMASQFKKLSQLARFSQKQLMEELDRMKKTRRHLTLAR